MTTAPQLVIVVPCYNEELVLPETAARLEKLLRSLIAAGQASESSCVTFVDDGSRDDTWKLIEGLSDGPQSVFRGIKLSRNHGHQQALLAGLLSAGGDLVVTIDADLQDDVEAIPRMLAAHAGGAHIVYGVRRDRPHDGWFKRVTARGYYRLLAALGVDLVVDHADFRLMSRAAIEALRQFPETNLFLRGLIPQLGFTTATVYYDRGPRFAGESKYPLGKMLALALDGITSFSAAPLRAITLLGVVLSAVSIGFAGWALRVRISNPAAVPGWASTVIPIYFLGAIQLLCTGIIGQYLAKIYLETKARPRFIIESVTEFPPPALDRNTEAARRTATTLPSGMPAAPGSRPR